ncbi:lipid-A-disaccharide synthase [Thermodesulfobacteriota bacterium]
MSKPRIMIVAGEASGDMHGANLAKALKRLAPQASICGMGGTAMAGAGVEILYDAARMAVVGIIEVISHFSDIRAARQTLYAELRDNRPDLLILIDYPGFNLMLAARAKKLGIPIFYYISPQVWAWHASRVKKISRLVNRMAVILPFEQEFYHQRGMEVDFVGHPLLDSVANKLSRAEFLADHDIPANATVVGLLPGSRKKEIASLLPTYLAAAQQLAEGHDELVFLLPLAPSLSRADLDANGLADCDLPIKVIAGSDRYDLMAACNAVIAASGTVTLELAILDIPMVVTYRTSPLTCWLARKLVDVKFVSLVNLIADREVVPELLQEEVTAERLTAQLAPLLFAPKVIESMRQGLSEVRERLGTPGASDRAAEIALDIIARHH